jgi:hypothetical protein
MYSMALAFFLVSACWWGGLAQRGSDSDGRREDRGDVHQRGLDAGLKVGLTVGDARAALQEADDRRRLLGLRP